jgi:polar amino acid transport system permease protein
VLIDWQYTIEILPELLWALRITLQATLTGFAVAVVLGLFLALARRSEAKILSRPAGWLVEFVRSTPLLVQLYFLFFILPRYGINLSPFITGLIGLGVHYSAYTSEIYRAGIDAVPRGQWEAATALSFSRRHTWTSVVLPQAVPPMIPALGNYLIAMFKDTPQLGAITFVEILLRAKIIASHSFRYTEPYTIVGLLFFILSYPSALIVRRLERRFGKSTG